MNRKTEQEDRMTRRLRGKCFLLPYQRTKVKKQPKAEGGGETALTRARRGGDGRFLKPKKRLSEPPCRVFAKIYPKAFGIVSIVAFRMAREAGGGGRR